ncbi:MAG: M12 family metallo-peptidase [Gammaproteobacteria bacterium]|nr:M12 family metallo-peptidase [Gammaproteobacteria bacterium]
MGSVLGKSSAWRTALLCVVLLLTACTESVPQTSSAVVPHHELLFYQRGDVGVKPRGVAADNGIQAVLANPTVLTSPLNTPYTLALGNGQQYTIVFTQRVVHRSGDVSLNGYLKSLGPEWPVALTQGQSAAFGSIRTPSGLIAIKTDQNGVWIVDVQKAGISFAPLINDQVQLSDTPNPGFKPGIKPRTSTRANDFSLVDVLVLYSRGLENRLGSAQAVNTRIHYLLNRANTALVDSNVQMRFRMVNLAPIDFSDSYSHEAALSSMSRSLAPFSNVENMRIQYGADLVTFVRDFVNDGSNSCGKALRNGASATALDAAKGFSVVADGIDGNFICDDYTLAHELVHGFGSTHGAGNAQDAGVFTYSYGYGVSGQFGTIMSYLMPQSGRFSNPRINTCFGRVCGVEGLADNARSLNETRAVVEAFVDAAPQINQVPTANTLPASNITQDGAQLNASIDPGALLTETWFEYGTTSADYLWKTEVQNITADILMQDVAQTISALECGKTYYFRAVASNADGVVQGVEESFATEACAQQPVQLLTLSATAVLLDDAKLNGELNSYGADAEYFFEYGVSDALEKRTAFVSVNVRFPTIVSQSIHGLACGTVYQFRFSVNAAGQVYNGETKSFTTKDCAATPKPDLPIPASIGETSALIQLDVLNGAIGDEVFLEYGPTSNFSYSTSVQTLTTETQLSFTLINLSCDTIYYVRGALRRGGEVFRGEQNQFSTVICASIGSNLLTGEISGVGQTGVTLNATLNPQPLSAEIYFEYGAVSVAENQTRSQIKQAPLDAVNVSQFIAGLTCDTTYQFRVVGRVGGETIIGETKTFKTNPCVTANALLETLDPQIESATSVQFRASVDPDGIPTKVYFEYGVGDVLDQTTPIFELGDGVLKREFSWSMSGLQCGVPYQYRVVTISTPPVGDQVTRVGAILTFTMPACEALKLTKIHSSTTNISAAVDVIVNTYGLPTSVYLNYGETSLKEKQTSTFEISNTATVHFQLLDLTCGTSYFFSVVASNANGGLVSNDEVIETQACAQPPSVQTQVAVDVTAISATLSAKVTPNGSSTSAYFEYQSGGLSPTNTTSEVVGAGFVDSFVAHKLNGLKCETEYSFKIIASNENGTTLGDELTFTTASCSAVPSSPLTTGSRTLDAGGEFTVVIGLGGNVIAWGDNSVGQLGIDKAQTSSFAGIRNADGRTIEEVIKVAAGQQHALALQSNGSILAWGDNSNGQLGNGSRAASITPVLVSGGEFANLSSIADINAGDRHSVAILNDGRVLSWGRNHLGQLGNLSKNDSDIPTLVNGVSTAKSVAVGANHNLLILDDGRLLAWGDNTAGQLGDGSAQPKLQVVDIPFEAEVKAVFAGQNSSFAIDASGQLWAWGENQFGQLGLGDREPRFTPTQLDLALDAGVSISDIAIGQGHALVLLSDGSLRTWGDNTKGQLARPLDSMEFSESPLVLWKETDTPLENIIAIAAGSLHSVALGEGGNVLAWGDGAKGQLGASGERLLSAVPAGVSDGSGNTLSLKVARLIVSESRLSIREGESKSLKLRLSTAPKSEIVVSYEIIGDDTVKVSEGASIRFTPENWDQDQKIVIQVGKDEDKSNDQATLIIRAEGYIDQNVSIMEEDRYPRKGPAVSSLDFSLLFGFFLLIAGSRYPRQNLRSYPLRTK